MPKGFLRTRCLQILIVGSVVAWCGGAALFAAVTVGVFSGFTHHISEQIMKDTVEFAAAEICTVWHYQQLKKKRIRPDVERTSFQQIGRDPEQSPCPTDFPDGINGARAAFAKTQSSLSLSLTFYQFALVGDRNDDGEYDATELQDVFESVGVSYMKHEGVVQHLSKLNGMFDTVRKTIEFSVLTDGMQALFTKGYRLTPADQDALNKVTGQQLS
jgi:hypothetical protein